MKSTSHFEIHSQLHSNDFSMPSMHTHSFHEYFLMISGSCDFYVEDRIYHINKGTCIIIPAGVPHKTVYTGSPINERLCMEFSSHYIHNLTDDFSSDFLSLRLALNPIKIPDSDFPNLLRALSSIMVENSNQHILGSYSSNYIRFLLEALLVKLLTYNSDNEMSNIRSNNSDDIKIKTALEFINRHFSEPLTLTQVASEMGLNSSYFSTKFKTCKGTGFKEYLTNLRLRKAERMLLETKRSITEIAFECGFESSNYFGDIFKKKNNVTPSYYRKIKGNIEG